MTGDTGTKSSGSETRKRSGVVGFRASAAERAELEAAAERAGLTLSSYVRAQSLAHPKTRATRRPSLERALLAQAVALLGRATGNLHQIAKRLNFGDVEYAADLPATLAETRAAIGRIMDAAGRTRRDEAA